MTNLGDSFHYTLAVSMRSCVSVLDVTFLCITAVSHERRRLQSILDVTFLSTSAVSTTPAAQRRVQAEAAGVTVICPSAVSDVSPRCRRLRHTGRRAGIAGEPLVQPSTAVSGVSRIAATLTCSRGSPIGAERGTERA